MNLTELITCESTAAISLHLRKISEAKISYSGHSPRPKALCGREVAWDTRIVVTLASCTDCRQIAMLPEVTY